MKPLKPRRPHPWGKGNVRLQVMLPREDALRLRRIARTRQQSISQVLLGVIQLVITSQPSRL